MRQTTLLLTLHTARQGLLEVTGRITDWTRRSGIHNGLLTIPLIEGRLALGTWQGIYLFEHRRRPPSRTLALHLIGETSGA